jgi:hypothetical protein
VLSRRFKPPPVPSTAIQYVFDFDTDCDGDRFIAFHAPGVGEESCPYARSLLGCPDELLYKPATRFVALEPRSTYTDMLAPVPDEIAVYLNASATPGPRLSTEPAIDELPTRTLEDASAAPVRAKNDSSTKSTCSK